MFVSGSSAVIWRELIMSNKGYIDTPNANVSQLFAAMIVNKALSVVFTVTFDASGLPYAGSRIVIS